MSLCSLIPMRWKAGASPLLWTIIDHQCSDVH